MVISAVCGAIRDLLMGNASQRLGANLRVSLFTSLVNQDVAFFDDNRIGDILSRIGSDTQVVQDGLTQAVVMFVKNLIIMIGMIGIMFTYSIRLTCFAILFLSPSLFASKFMMNLFMSDNVKYQKSKAGMAAHAGEALSNVRVVKAFANETKTIEEFNRTSDDVYNIGFKKGINWGWFMLVLSCLRSIAIIGIMYLASIWYEQEHLTIGSTMAYLLYMQQFGNAFFEFFNQIQAVAKVRGASMEIAKLIVQKPIVVIKDNGTQATQDGAEEGSLIMQDMRFHYPSKEDVPVLKGVNIEVKKNQIVALVGASGCGKSSVIQLIERFYDPIEGKLLYNGIDLKDIDNQWYH